MTDRAMRRRETERKSGLCERQLRNLEAEGKFPRRFLIAEDGRAVAWSENEVDKWLAKRLERREQISKPGMLRSAGERTAAV